MPVGGPGSERTFIWIITCILFMCVLAGGGCLIAYTFFPESGIPSWTPLLGITLVSLPWTFWLLTFFYRIFSRCCGCRIDVVGIGKEGLGYGNGGHDHEIAPGAVDASIFAQHVETANLRPESTARPILERRAKRKQRE
ncbi:hypothetical protein CR513_04787, partial [Mucuna pruriens]